MLPFFEQTSYSLRLEDFEEEALFTEDPVVGVATGVTTATGTATGAAVCSFLREDEDFEEEALFTEDPVVGVATGVTTATGTATGAAVCRSRLSALAETAKRAAMIREKDFIVDCIEYDRLLGVRIDIVRYLVLKNRRLVVTGGVR